MSQLVLNTRSAHSFYRMRIKQDLAQYMMGFEAYSRILAAKRIVALKLAVKQGRYFVANFLSSLTQEGC